jgi:NADH-quinone oxidoreductase subunit L
MRDETRATARFFAYLNLFVFVMLVLVLSDNFLLLFVGWEGVGLVRYLLIGFWFTEPASVATPARRRSSSTASATSASCSPCSLLIHQRSAPSTSPPIAAA